MKKKWEKWAECTFERRMHATMDFVKIKEKRLKDDGIELSPDFIVSRSKDLMVRGKSFYAVWDEKNGLWSTDEYTVQRLVDEMLYEQASYLGDRAGYVSIKTMEDFSTRSWASFKLYLNNLADSYHVLDDKLTFSNMEVKKTDYVTKTLPYPLEEGPIKAWDELISTLYDPEEREKIEWAIGAVVSGDSTAIQKFIVLYGEAGGGKSTVLNIIQKLFDGYYVMFNAQALTNGNSQFALDMFRSNPLVAIQHDGDLSKSKDITALNSLVSHEEMTINEKFKASYVQRARAFIFMGTNKPVKINDSKSGLLRRLIDVRTSGRLLPPVRYQELNAQIDFELGAIASHCLSVYRELGKHYYSAYRPMEMLYETDYFFNFVEDMYYQFKKANYLTLTKAFKLYKDYCAEANIEYRLPKPKFRAELRGYFQYFYDRYTTDEGDRLRSVYVNFREEKFISATTKAEDTKTLSLILDAEGPSIFDTEYADMPAQYAVNNTVPGRKWANVTTKLSDLDTSKLHYVQVPSNHIVVDFDIKDETGEKSLARNLEAANKWPPTYAEYSKSGKGIHLHYIYDEDPSKLSIIYSEGIEIKKSVGDASIRRKLTQYNNVPIAHISSGLPLKEEKESMINFKRVTSEKGLIKLIKRNLKKEIHPATKPSIDFIYTILEDAYDSGLTYDVSQLRQSVLNFALKSTNNSEYCLGVVSKMKFASMDKLAEPVEDEYDDDKLVFFDVEVFSNLFVVCWKYQGKQHKVVRMINPSPQEIEGLMRLKLVGFNNRLYDGHILYARYLGYSIPELFEVSGKIISKERNGYFREAYNLCYADVYDFSSKKQSLKAFEIELGLKHSELNHPWDEPVPPELVEKVVDYCADDVEATEQVFDSRKQDYIARQILADLSGLPVIHTTKAHTARILFGSDPEPFKKFVYTDLSEEFPGYVFDDTKPKDKKSLYKGINPSEGGYVYSEPGMYSNVALLDVASMHPASILALNLFGPYTKRYRELVEARLAIKHKDYEKAKKMLGGLLSKYLDDPKDAEALAYALKIHALNIVYGLTAATFPNPFKDPRNVDNIVAKRGALFMIDLQLALKEHDIQLCHIKTDSVKLVDPSEEDLDFVFEFAKKYGYTFEHEATYDRFCLINKAVYVARYETKDGKKKWTATGTQFIHPYVFKTLFSGEAIEFSDLCETKAVTSPSLIYLDMNEGLPDVTDLEAELSEREKESSKKLSKDPKISKLSIDELKTEIAKGHNYKFVGKVGSFCPVTDGNGGGILYRFKDGKYYAISGTKGFRWLESDIVSSQDLIKEIDLTYHNGLVDAAADQISKFGDLTWFRSNE